MYVCVLLDRDELPIQVELRVSGHEVVVQMVVICVIIFIVVGQAVHYLLRVTIHMLDGEVKVGEVLPPSSLLA